jgi:hypothetical protein
MRLGRIKLAFRADGRPIAVVIPPIMIVLTSLPRPSPPPASSSAARSSAWPLRLWGRVARSLDRLGHPGVPPAPHRSAGAERTGSGA